MAIHQIFLKPRKLLEQVINSEKGILKDKDILVVVKSLDESCVTLETRAWVNTADYWNVRFNLLERYKNIFDENGIEIPFNQLDVHMKSFLRMPRKWILF